jgi:hypothetical protein
MFCRTSELLEALAAIQSRIPRSVGAQLVETKLAANVTLLALCQFLLNCRRSNRQKTLAADGIDDAVEVTSAGECWFRLIGHLATSFQSKIKSLAVTEVCLSRRQLSGQF